MYVYTHTHTHTLGNMHMHILIYTHTTSTSVSNLHIQRPYNIQHHALSIHMFIRIRIHIHHRYKRTITPYKKATEEERAKVRGEVEGLHGLFKQYVKDMRGGMSTDLMLPSMMINVDWKRSGGLIAMFMIRLT